MRLTWLFAVRLTVPGLLAILCGIHETAPAQSVAGFAHERDISAGVPPGYWATWSGTSLVWVEANKSAVPMVCVSNREGQREEIALDLPGADTTWVRAAAAGSDGALAVTGLSWKRGALVADFLVWISPDRTRRTVTRLSPYVAEVITVAGDGTIWTLGAVRTDNPDRNRAALPLLRRFDTSGRGLSSQSVNARARPGIAPDSVSLSYLFASRDRVGWFTNGCEYVEFELDGRERERFDGPPGLELTRVSGVALDVADRVFLGRLGQRFEILQLDRGKRTWELVPVRQLTVPEWARILGFDGATLITGEEGGVMRRHIRTDSSPVPN